MNSATLTEQDYIGIHKSTVLPAGTAAPDFTLKSTPDETVTLSDFRGHPVILPPQLRDEIRAADATLTLHDILKRHPDLRVDVDVTDRGVGRDVDRPADLEA